jgi:hypothetical protein
MNLSVSHVRCNVDIQLGQEQIVSKTIRSLALVVLLVSVIAVNVSADVAMEVAPEAALPCWDMYQNCKKTHTQEFCDGVWCGCMNATYGGSHC